MVSIKSKLIALVVALGLIIGSTLYGIHLGKAQCENKILSQAAKVTQQNEKISDTVRGMSGPDLDAALDYWMRD